MAILPIATFDDDILRKQAKPVERNSERLQKLVDDMFETMYNANGVGLAAPQIGKALRIFVADPGVYENNDNQKARDPITMINPEITMQSSETNTTEEGCLSIPDVTGPVTRAQKIVVEFKDRYFNQKKLNVEGQIARIFQHEIDHLNGVLFIDHLSYFKRKLIGAKLRNLAEGSEQIEYPVIPKVSAQP